jgi:hypothetical protein
MLNNQMVSCLRSLFLDAKKSAREKRNAIPGGCDALPSGTAGCLGKGGSTGGGNRFPPGKGSAYFAKCFFVVGLAWVLKKKGLRWILMWLESWNRGTVEKTFGYFWDEHGTTKWGPQTIAKLVNITPISLWFMVRK